MKMFEVNLNEVPAGLTQKEFLKQPALKKISGWVTAAGVTGGDRGRRHRYFKWPEYVRHCRRSSAVLL